MELRSKELAAKQLLTVITDVYEELHEDDEILTAPDNDYGLFKYGGSNPEAQFYLSKISKKRDVQRAGLGFVIRRAELPDRFRISADVEISSEVAGKEAERILELMNVKSQSDFGMQSPEFIVYFQPAHSGVRGWDNKTFVGIEVDITEDDFDGLPKMRKKILASVRKLFQALDYALTQD